MYARVSNRIKKREGKAPQTTKAKGETKLIEKTHEKHVAKGKCSLLTWCHDRGCPRTEASEECCSADFATHSLCWLWNSLSLHIAISTYHFTSCLKKKMQFSAIFYHFALISSHILIGSHRQKNTAHKKVRKPRSPTLSSFTALSQHHILPHQRTCPQFFVMRAK